MTCHHKVGPFRCCSIVQGDALNLVKKMKSRSVGITVTDPPYGVGKKYVDGQSVIADVVPYEVLPDLLRVTEGPIMWFGSATKVDEAFKSFSTAPERILIWAPAFTTSSVRSNGIFYRWQPIYCWNLPKKAASPVHDVLTQSTETRRRWWNHPGTKPTKLMTALIQMSGGICFDPFMGSGTTAVAAKALERCFFGFEMSKEYVEICNRRLSQTECSVGYEKLL